MRCETAMNNAERLIDPGRTAVFADPRRRTAGVNAEPRSPMRVPIRPTIDRLREAPREGGSMLTTGLLPASMGLLIWLAAILIVLGGSIP